MKTDNNKFSENITTSYQFCDGEQKLAFPFIWKLMQGAASKQLHFYYDSLEYLRSIKRAYVIMRCEINFYKKIPPYENIKVSTWARENAMLKMVRNYSIELANSEIACDATSAWAYIDLETKKPILLSDVEHPVDICTDDVYSVSIKRRVLPACDGEHIMSRKTIHTDIDLYGHMNNAKYFDIVYDIIPVENLQRLHMDYICECVEGEILDIRKYEIDNKLVVFGRKEDGTVSFCCEAEYGEC